MSRILTFCPAGLGGRSMRRKHAGSRGAHGGGPVFKVDCIGISWFEVGKNSVSSVSSGPKRARFERENRYAITGRRVAGAIEAATGWRRASGRNHQSALRQQLVTPKCRKVTDHQPRRCNQEKARLYWSFSILFILSYSSYRLKGI